MRVLAIDPGNMESAWVVYENQSPPELFDKPHYSAGKVLDKGYETNSVVRTRLAHIMDFYQVKVAAIEMIASYGMPVGRSVFETCIAIGRFQEILERAGILTELIYRGDVKLNLCNSRRAKDGNIRQALIDRFPAVGGGSRPQIGTKKEPGPLYGVSGDIWAALAVAVHFVEIRKDVYNNL